MVNTIMQLLECVEIYYYVLLSYKNFGLLNEWFMFILCRQSRGLYNTCQGNTSKHIQVLLLRFPIIYFL